MDYEWRRIKTKTNNVRNKGAQSADGINKIDRSKIWQKPFSAIFYYIDKTIFPVMWYNYLIKKHD